MVAINESIRIEATADFDPLVRGTKKARDELGRFTKAVDKADKEMVQSNRTLRDSSDKLGKYARQLDRVEKAQRGMASGVALAKRGLVSLGVYMSVRQLQQYGDEWTNLRNRVKLFTKDQAETNKVVEALFTTSQETRQSVSATAEVYQRFAQANKQLGMSQNEMLTVMKTVNQTVAISGVSSASAAAALTQLGQGMASGVLRGEELNSILEQTPRLAQAIAEGMGTNVGQLRKLGAEGAITAQKVLGALAKERAKVQAEFEKTAPTIDQSLTTMSNSFGHFIDQLEQQYGIFAKIADKIGGLAKVMGEGTMQEKMADFVVEEGQAFLKDAVEGWFGLRKVATSIGGIAGHAQQAGADFSSGVYRLGVQGAERYGAIGPETAARGYQQADMMNTGRTTPYMMRYGPSLDPNQDPNRSGTYKWGVGKSSGNPSDFMMQGSFAGTGGTAADYVKPPAVVAPTIPTRPTTAFSFTPSAEDADDLIPKSLTSASEEARDFADDMRQLGLDFAIADKQAQMLAETEMDQLKVSQGQERQSYKSALATEQQLEQLDGLHEAEQVKLQDTLDATKATEDAAEATATMAEGIEVANELGMALGEIFGGSKGAQMVQNAMGLADAIAKQNPLGVFANTLGLVTTALSGTSDELNEFAESSDRLGRQLSAANKATQSATKGYLGEVEFDRQMEVLLSPVKHAFDTFAGESRLTGSGDLDTLANFFEAMSTQSLGGNDTGIMGDIRSFIEEMDNAGNTSGKENISSYMLKLQALLGDDATLLDAAQNMFRLEDSIRETGDAAGKAAADMSRERSVRMEFDVEEMALRKTAQERMQDFAGADPYLQNRIFSDLGRSIDSLRSRESASIRAARTSGSAKVAVGSGSSSGGSTSPTSPTTGVDGSGALVPEVRLNEIVLDEWADVVDVSSAAPIERNWNDIVPLIGGGTGHKRINPEHWYNVIELYGGLERNKIKRNWNEVIPLLGMAHKRINPGKWENVINLPAFDDNVIDRNWNEVIPLLGMAHKRIDPKKWENVINLRESLDSDDAKIGRNWSQILTLSPSPVSDFTVGGEAISRWSQIVRLERVVQGASAGKVTMGLGKHKRNWSEAVQFTASPVSDYGISRWSQIVRLERVVQGASAGKVTMGLGKHSRPWSDAVHFYPLGTTRNEFQSYLNMDRLNGGDSAGWSSVVQLPDGLGKHGRPWSDAITFRPGSATEFGIDSWGDIFNLDDLGTLDLDVGAAVRLVGERAKIDISDLIDMGALDGIITKSVNRAIRDRSVTVKPGASNSSSGTSTPSNSQKSNFRGGTSSGSQYGGRN
jgi:tape measure domain-containing protein